MILIITTQYDKHADRVLKELDMMGEKKYFRWNSDTFPATSKVSFTYPEGSIIFDNSDKKINSSLITTAWFRRLENKENSILTGDEKKISKGAVKTLNDWICNSLIQCEWLSTPWNIKAAENKIMQMKIARELEFQMPNTLITNSITELEKFYANFNGEIIIKPMESLLRKNLTNYENNAFANLGSDMWLKEMKQREPEMSPIFAQEYIRKKSEIRVTIVGDRIFATEICSQQYSLTSVDWRRQMYLAIKPLHRIFNLPKEIEDKCFKLVNNLDLGFGAIDLILTPEDEFYFLEINPNGQFEWIEILTGQPISRAIAERLIAIMHSN